MTFYKFAIAVTAAASLSFSCHREEFAPESDAPDGIELTFGSDSAIVTKTEWDGETIQLIYAVRLDLFGCERISTRLQLGIYN